MAVQRRKYSFDAEKQILINLITNNEYCRAILPLLQEEYFTSKSAGIIIQWVQEYFDAYESAPKYGITDVFDHEGINLSSEDKDHVEKILQHLYDIDYDNEETNTPYLIDKGKEFLRKRHLELKIKAAQHHSANGDLESAEQVLASRFDLPEELDIVKSWDDEEWNRKVIHKMASRDDPDSAFFRYPGRLGDFLGNIDAGWFMGYVGPSKRGKTVYLMETVHCGIQRRMNTLFYSLEMPSDQLFMRSMKSISGGKLAEEEYETMFPTFDCELNQNGECDKEQRVGFGSLENEEGELDGYENNPDWKQCTACRGTPDFHPTSWLVPMPKRAYNEDTYFKKVNSFMRLFGRYGKTIFQPSKTATIETIDNHLYTLEHQHNWIPHIVVLDYADLLKPTRSNNQKRFELYKFTALRVMMLFSCKI